MMSVCGERNSNQTLLVGKFGKTKWCKIYLEITETLAHGYASESTQRELLNEYQQARVSMVFQRVRQW